MVFTGKIEHRVNCSIPSIMKNTIFEILLKRWRWMRCRPMLEAVTSLDEFRRLMDKRQDPIFKEYEGWNQISRVEFSAAMDSLGIDLRGRSFLDIGPGYGASLDVARERGATTVDFIDYDPFVCTFNRLKGFTAIKLDARKNLEKTGLRKYDVIWIKATFSADKFIKRERSLIPLLQRYPRLKSLLDRINDLAAPQGRIIFCPHWKTERGKRVCIDVRNTSITQIFLNNGYKILPVIDGHNSEVYPITFLKQVQ